MATSKKPPAAKAEAPPEPPITLGAYASSLDAGQRVLAAGMAAAKPELGEAELSPAGWASELSRYAKSPTTL